jgi:hypothetical protein
MHLEKLKRPTIWDGVLENAIYLIPFFGEILNTWTLTYSYAHSDIV